MKRQNPRVRPFLIFWEGIMTANGKSRTPKHPLIWLALLTMAMFMNSCRTDEVEVPPLTGPSGARLFITMSADPDHLVIRAPGQSRQSSRITAQLKNQLGQGVPNEIVKFRIANKEGSEVNIGSLSALTATTDGAGFARVVYRSPNSLEQPIPTRIYILAIMTNPAFTFEVTGQHALDLEAAVPPIDCTFGGSGAPVAAFTFTPSPGTINQPVCFDAQASTDNGVIVAASWNFGDGSTGAGITTCHTFTSEGFFNVTLTIQDDDRNCSTITQLVEINTGDTATCSILVSPQNPPLGSSVLLTAVIVDDGRVRHFSWNFGDGTTQTTSTNSVSHLYGTAGTFTVLLEIRDDQGNISNCTTTVTVGSNAPSCSFTASPSTGSIGDSIFFDASASADTDGSIVDYTWNFGDGSATVSTEADPTITHSYNLAGTFTVTLNITDDQDNVTTCSITVVISSDAPDCDFTIGQNPIDVGDTASFNASGSSDPDGTIVDFTWDFGDNTPSVSTGTNPQATHQYNTAGTFTVTLTLTDNDGNTSSCSNDITVGANPPPTCSFTRNPGGNIVTGTLVTLDASASVDPDGGALTFAWSTPGGTPPNGTGNPFDTTYNTAGTFTITLTVTDDEGQSTNCQQTVTVTNGLAPTCSASGSPNPADVGQTVNFTGTAADADTPSAQLTFNWNFADGSPDATTQNASHAFSTDGNFTVTFTVQDPQGNQCVDTVDMVIAVVPDISISDVSSAEAFGSASFNITLSQATTVNVTVLASTQDGTGIDPATTADNDYVAQSATVTFTPGQTLQVFTVTINDDATNEPDETFNVNLTIANNGNIVDPQGVGTIQNDDP